jgi:hypothetical protein
MPGIRCPDQLYRSIVHGLVLLDEGRKLVPQRSPNGAHLFWDHLRMIRDPSRRCPDNLVIRDPDSVSHAGQVSLEAAHDLLEL